MGGLAPTWLAPRNLDRIYYLSCIRQEFERSPVPRTQEERKADTRARLLDAAAGLFAERGIDAVSVDTVADAAGRTSGAVYAHFGSKQGLLMALLDEWAHSLLTVIAAEFELAATVEDRLRAVAANVVTNPSDQTRRLLLLEREMWLRATRDPEVAQTMRARSRQAHDWLTKGFATWIDEGLVAPIAPPDVLATVFRALVIGFETQHRIDPESLDTGVVAVRPGTRDRCRTGADTAFLAHVRQTSEPRIQNRDKETAVHTEICDRLGIEFPIFAFTHCRDVVAAVSNAGGIGVLGAIGFSPEELEIELDWLDEHVGDNPYGVDIVIPGKYEGMGEMDPVKLEAQLQSMVPDDHRRFAAAAPRRARRARARRGPDAQRDDGLDRGHRQAAAWRPRCATTRSSSSPTRWALPRRM